MIIFPICQMFFSYLYRIVTLIFVENYNQYNSQITKGKKLCKINRKIKKTMEFMSDMWYHKS